MLGMLLFLNLEVIFQITFYVLNGLSYLDRFRVPPEYVELKNKFELALEGMRFPHTTCLATAVVLNCKNWIYYYSKIGVMAYRADPTDPEREKLYKAHKKL